jgi:2-methylcitrate dehydratase
MCDPTVKALMNRIEITENKDFTREYPGKLQTRIEVITKSGERIVELAQYPKGHSNNPMSDADMNSKFGAMCAGVVATTRRDALLSAFWDIDQAADLDDVFELLRIDCASE